jgi:hypothetical protein
MRFAMMGQSRSSTRAGAFSHTPGRCGPALAEMLLAQTPLWPIEAGEERASA